MSPKPALRRVAPLLVALLVLLLPSVARAADTQDMYRLYNHWSGEHHYTADAVECDRLRKLGWTYEGVAWTAPVTSNTPVYRLYNPYAPQGDHHYTTSKGEYDRLAEIGWRQEGVGWYSDDDKGVELHRLFNPYALSCTHHYTASEEERDALVKLGWRYEGTAWYGVAEKPAEPEKPVEPETPVEPEEPPVTPEEPPVTPEDDFVYEKNDDGTFDIVGYTGSDESVIVPARHEGGDIDCVDFKEEKTPNLAKMRHLSFEEGSRATALMLGSYDENNSIYLETIDLSNLTELEVMEIWDQGTLSGLDLSSLSKLELAGYINADWIVRGDTSWDAVTSYTRPRAFEGVKLGENDSLTQLDVQAGCFAGVAAPELSEAPKLRSVRLIAYGLSSVDLDGLSRLSIVDVSFNDLTALDLDVSGCPDLRRVTCEANRIAHLDVALVRKLGERGGDLNCAYNRLDNVDEIQSVAQEYPDLYLSIEPQGAWR